MFLWVEDDAAAAAIEWKRKLKKEKKKKRLKLEYRKQGSPVELSKCFPVP